MAIESNILEAIGTNFDKFDYNYGGPTFSKVNSANSYRSVHIYVGPKLVPIASRIFDTIVIFRRARKAKTVLCRGEILEIEMNCPKLYN